MRLAVSGKSRKPPTRVRRAVTGVLAARLFTQPSITLLIQFFHIAFLRKALNLGLTFTLIYGYNISVKVGDSYVF